MYRYGEEMINDIGTRVSSLSAEGLYEGFMEEVELLNLLNCQMLKGFKSLVDIALRISELLICLV